jgi:bile acid:Na+ symporter, BASS family
VPSLSLVVAALLAALSIVSTLSAGLEAETRGGLRLRTLARTWIANVVAVPALMLGIAAIIELEPEARTALLLIALSPGGASGPLLSRLAGGGPDRIGRLYLLLVVSSVPMLLLSRSVFAARDSRPLTWETAAILLQLAPLFVGVAIRRHRPAAIRHAALLQRWGGRLLGLIIILLLVSRGSSLASLQGSTLLAMAGLCVGSLGVGALFSEDRRVPDAIITTVRNLTLALLLAEAVEPGGRLTILVATYGLFMYLSVLVLLRLAPDRRPS